jgi:hypothetical protein
MVQENFVTLKLNWKHCSLACIDNINIVRLNINIVTQNTKAYVSTAPERLLDSLSTTLSYL